MKKGVGLPVFSGVAIGPAVVYRKAQRTLPVPSGDPAVEKAKFEAALETARQPIPVASIGMFKGCPLVNPLSAGLTAHLHTGIAL